MIIPCYATYYQHNEPVCVLCSFGAYINSLLNFDSDITQIYHVDVQKIYNMMHKTQDGYSVVEVYNVLQERGVYLIGCPDVIEIPKMIIKSRRSIDELMSDIREHLGCIVTTKEHCLYVCGFDIIKGILVQDSLVPTNNKSDQRYFITWNFLDMLEPNYFIFTV